MPTAPTPGRVQADAAARVRVRMTIGDKTLEVQPSALSLDEKFVIRNATGLPIEAFFTEGQNTIGEDSLAVLWWVARRANGEPHLPWNQFKQQWVFDPDSFDIEEVIDDDEDEAPEGSGPDS